MKYPSNQNEHSNNEINILFMRFQKEKKGKKKQFVMYTRVYTRNYKIYRTIRKYQ